MNKETMKRAPSSTIPLHHGGSSSSYPPLNQTSTEENSNGDVNNGDPSSVTSDSSSARETQHYSNSSSSNINASRRKRWLRHARSARERTVVSADTTTGVPISSGDTISDSGDSALGTTSTNSSQISTSTGIDSRADRSLESESSKKEEGGTKSNNEDFRHETHDETSYIPKNHFGSDGTTNENNDSMQLGNSAPGEISEQNYHHLTNSNQSEKYQGEIIEQSNRSPSNSSKINSRPMTVTEATASACPLRSNPPPKKASATRNGNTISPKIRGSNFGGVQNFFSSTSENNGRTKTMSIGHERSSTFEDMSKDEKNRTEPVKFNFDESHYANQIDVGHSVDFEGGKDASYISDTDDDDDDELYFQMPPTTIIHGDPQKFASPNPNSSNDQSHHSNALDYDQNDKVSQLEYGVQMQQGQQRNQSPTHPPSPPLPVGTFSSNSSKKFKGHNRNDLQMKDANPFVAGLKNPPPPPSSPPPRSKNRGGSTRRNHRNHHYLQYHQQHPASQSNALPNHGHNSSLSSSCSSKKHQNSSHHESSHEKSQPHQQRRPTLEPYVTRLEIFELFSTQQCYYLVACDKHGTSYRILKMDRTLIERQKGTGYVRANGGTSGGSDRNIISSTSSTSPANRSTQSFDGFAYSEHGEESPQAASGTGEDGVGDSTISNFSAKEEKNPQGVSPNSNASGSKTLQHTQQHQQNQSHQHNQKSTFRRLSEFVFEDPATYSQSEIKDILDMINDGNRGDDSHLYLSSSSKEFDGIGGGGQENFSQRRKGLDGGAGNTGRGNNGGGLKPICKAYGILGFIRFLDCYYLTLITKRAKVGSIGGNSIYTIKSTETFPLKPAERTPSSSASSENAANDPSSMLLSMWNRGKRSVGLGLTNREIAELRYQGLYQVVDLSKNFFFSYTYDLTRSLQENFLAMTSQPFPPPPFKDMYAWNYFLTRELEESTNSLTSFQWILPVIHGAFIQRKIHDYGRTLNLILMARRSRHFAGTRYLKRGVSDRGKVANDVEHEQMIQDESTSEGVFSSYLQIRGSIPTYWTQESSVTMPKPPIVLNRVDPTYQATQAHFEDLLKRYGSPIIVVDLVKQSEKREREVIVGNEFRNAIDYINCHIDDQHKILYCALDYSHISKHRNLNVSSSLNDVATWSVNQTGFFCSNPQWKIVESGEIAPFDEDCYRGATYMSQRLGVPFFPMEQLGILRTNCIDCLDRTNVAQFSAGVEALGQQLVVMGIRSSPKLDPSSIIVRMLIDMYVEIGDQIALQYGGSEAHKKVASAGTNSNIPGPMGKHKELLTSIRRYYSNAFTDRLKQDAMNLFLGYYVPSSHTVPLWELENDYYLHNFHNNAGKGSLQSMKSYQSMFGVDWNDGEEDCKLDRDIQRTSLAHKRSESAGSLVGKAEPTEGRIDRVKDRCKSQNNALSVWWKVAIQSYIQQRMWMQLGGHRNGSSMPPRFERLYHPNELSQFDKFFARPWATPSRLSHEDQHKPPLDGDIESGGIPPRKATPTSESKVTLFDERVQSSKGGGTKIDDNDEEEDCNLTLRDFVEVYGFGSKNRSSLKQLLKAHTQKENLRLEHAQSETKENNHLQHVGSLEEKTEPCPKYLDYASSATMPRRSFRQGAREEFALFLRDTNLDSNDVEGIRNLSESAHIGQEIKSGAYRGLNQNESAVHVATAIYSHFNFLDEKVEKGELNYDEFPPGVTEKLQQENIFADGVLDSFYSGWANQARAEKSYAEIVDMATVGFKRSDVTTEASMRLYSSFYDGTTQLNQLEQAYTIGQKLPHDPSKPLRRSTRPCEKISGSGKEIKSFDESSFILKAAARGINVRKSSSQTQRLFTYQPQHIIPAGFEQINEDLYARKDNKFMVFNSAGVKSWKTPPRPVTKTNNYNFKIY